MPMPIYNLSELMFTSPYFTAMDCVLHGQKAIYCSTEFTSGLRAYTAMSGHGVKSAKELKKQLGEDWYEEHISVPNRRSAEEFARSVCRARMDGTPVINPVPLKIPGWDQPEYLAFWEELIRTRVKEVRFNKHWEFSSGCTFEFVAATMTEIPTFDADGKEISYKTALQSIEAAISRFQSFDTKKLQANLERLKTIQMDLGKLDSTTKRVRS